MCMYARHLGDVIDLGEFEGDAEGGEEDGDVGAGEGEWAHIQVPHGGGGIGGVFQGVRQLLEGFGDPPERLHPLLLLPRHLTRFPSATRQVAFSPFVLFCLFIYYFSFFSFIYLYF